MPQQVRRPGAFKRTLRNTTIGALALVVILLGAGVLYVVFGYKSVAVPQVASEAASSQSMLLSPKPPAANAPESAAVQSLTSPVHPGEQATISVKTNAGSSCTIKLDYAGAPDSGSLGIQGTDIYGEVTWTWPVSSKAPLGSWPVTVTCLYHGRSAVVAQNMEVVAR